MITQSFSYNGISFDPNLMRGGYKANVVVVPQISVRQLVLNLAGQNGVETYNAYLGQLVLRIKGEVRGTTESDLYSKMNDLIEAFDPNNTEAQGSDGFLALNFTEGNTSNTYYVKTFKSMPVFQESLSQGLTVPFDILVFARDPVKYTQTTKSVTLQAASAAGGASALPASIPIAISSSTATASGTATNNGTSDVWPTQVRINGPVTGPKVENATEGKYYSFSNDLVLASGEYVDIDMNRNTALKTDSNGTQTSVIQYRTSASEPFKIKRGNNTLNYTSGGTMDATSSVVIQWQEPA